MFLLFRLLSKKDFLYTYTHWTVFLFQSVAILIGLSLIWFTSQALAPAFAAIDVGFGESYFQYVVTGEILIFLPMAIFSNMSSMMRYWVSEGVMDDVLLSRFSVPRQMVIGGLAGLGKEAVYFTLMIAVAITVFNYQMPFPEFLLVLALHVLILPVSLGLGMLSASILLLFGRGDSAIAHIVSALTLAAGVYFPLSAFPETFRSLSEGLSPYTAFVEMGRAVMHSEPNFSAWSLLVIWSGAVLVLGWVTVAFSVRHYKKSGTVTLLRF